LDKKYVKIVEELYEREQIRTCLARYARGNDRTDRDLLRSVYHEVSWDDHGPVQCTGPELADLAVFDAPSRLGTQHLLGQMMIELDGDTAYAETYFIAHAMTTRPFLVTLEDHGPLESGSSGEVGSVMVLLGRYVDRLDKVDGAWRITVRKVLVDWGNEMSGPFDPAVLARVHRSQRYPNDIVYHLGDLRLPESLLGAK
jgi:hypothetical protein